MAKTEWLAVEPMASACREAREWAAHFETLQAAWDACERGDWMLWYLWRTQAGEPWSDERRPLVWAAAQCARLAPRPYLSTIVVIERWALEHGDGRPTSADVRAAAADADADADADAAARYDTLRKCAALVRRLWPDPTQPAVFPPKE